MTYSTTVDIHSRCIKITITLHFSFCLFLDEKCVPLAEKIGKPPILKIVGAGDTWLAFEV